MTAAERTLQLARELQVRASNLLTSGERRKQAELARMVECPSDKATLAALTDEAFRSARASRTAEHLSYIFKSRGVPGFFSPAQRVLLKGFSIMARLLPGPAVAIFKHQIRKETANVILPGEREALAEHLRRRTREGTRMNVNFLGEAILSEPEARRRLDQYLGSLEWPEIEVLSIKISTVYSQISPLAREHTVNTIADRLQELMSAAAKSRFRTANGLSVPKFIYLDMEEYRDKELTAEAFMRALNRPGMEGVRSGIALQSYLPDSFETLQCILAWARARVASGGGRITIRLVKGANMEMERVEASIRGWAQAPYQTKLETDANYKRMVHECLKPENLAAADVGIASHNLFELAYAFVLARDAVALDRVQFEMLEGMANNQRRALLELSARLLIYAPACRREHFLNAIGYLIRRLDENTGPENFLRHVFHISVDTPEWKRLEGGFVDSVEAIPRVSTAPRRQQDRLTESWAEPRLVTANWQDFHNEPDTDFSLPQNSLWADEIVRAWQSRSATTIPLVIAGTTCETANKRPLLDPSRPSTTLGECCQAGPEHIDRALQCAKDDPDGWRRLRPEERCRMLGEVAQELRKARATLIGAALANGGKTISESDPEVSEAVDFVEFYRSNALWWQTREGLQAEPKGTVIVVSPWNFPIAIPCGGVAAALAAGNTVILKPASDTVLLAWELCQCFWRAGISRRVLQFVPCAGGTEGRLLVNDARTSAVVLTGGTATAQTMFRDKPQIQLFAETGGKDATIVTALSDRDQAIKHILHSAFSHSGQKCSATSLLLLQDEIYDDPAFRRNLCEALASLPPGPAWDLKTRIGPLIRPPSGDLKRALTTLEAGEEWALEPRNVEGNPNLWTPGIKYGVRPGSYTHMTEFFGPVLAVMRFTSLTEAIELVNQTGYGLTSGLESLDSREWDTWKNGIRAGNLYINRVTTGAVVLRQPFGGFGKSVFGSGMKAGGPNYVAQLMDFKDVASAARETAESKDDVLNDICEGLVARNEWQAAARLRAASTSYEEAVRTEFGSQHDHFKLVGQDNFRRYLPFKTPRVRVHPDDSAFDIIARLLALRALQRPAQLSIPPGLSSPALHLLREPNSNARWFSIIEESDAELAAQVRSRAVDRVRYADPWRVELTVLQAAAESGVGIVSVPVSAEGRLELLWYLQEQSLSIDYHRYGNLGDRADEERCPVA